MHINFSVLNIILYLNCRNRGIIVYLLVLIFILTWKQDYRLESWDPCFVGGYWLYNIIDRNRLLLNRRLNGRWLHRVFDSSWSGGIFHNNCFNRAIYWNRLYWIDERNCINSNFCLYWFHSTCDGKRLICTFHDGWLHRAAYTSWLHRAIDNRNRLNCTFDERRLHRAAYTSSLYRATGNGNRFNCTPNNRRLYRIAYTSWLHRTTDNRNRLHSIFGSNRLHWVSIWWPNRCNWGRLYIFFWGLYHRCSWRDYNRRNRY